MVSLFIGVKQQQQQNILAIGSLETKLTNKQKKTIVTTTKTTKITITKQVLSEKRECSGFGFIAFLPLAKCFIGSLVLLFGDVVVAIAADVVLWTFGDLR